MRFSDKGTPSLDIVLNILPKLDLRNAVAWRLLFFFINTTIRKGQSATEPLSYSDLANAPGLTAKPLAKATVENALRGLRQVRIIEAQKEGWQGHNSYRIVLPFKPRKPPRKISHHSDRLRNQPLRKRKLNSSF